MKEGEATEWSVGDLCTCVYDDRGYGILFRVTNVVVDSRWSQPMLDIVPVLGVLQNVSKRRPKKRISAGYCGKQSLVDLANEYAQLGLFIAQEAKKLGGDDGPTSDT